MSSSPYARCYLSRSCISSCIPLATLPRLNSRDRWPRTRTTCGSRPGSAPPGSSDGGGLRRPPDRSGYIIFWRRDAWWRYTARGMLHQRRSQREALESRPPRFRRPPMGRSHARTPTNKQDKNRRGRYVHKAATSGVHTKRILVACIRRSAQAGYSAQGRFMMTERGTKVKRGIP